MPRELKTERLVAFLPPSMKSALTQRAQELEVSVSELVREYVEGGLNADDPWQARGTEARINADDVAQTDGTAAFPGASASAVEREVAGPFPPRG